MEQKDIRLIGIVVGGAWFLASLRHFSEQGFVAIGMPLLILGLGIVYFRKGSDDAS